MYICTDFSVRRIRVINCEKHKWIDECLKDPHCGWINNSTLLSENENQWYNRCRSIEYIKDNNLQNANGVYTHENYDISITTPKSCPPEKPQYLRATNTTENKLQLRWIPGFDGGHDQTFILEYRNGETGSWMKITVDSSTSDDDPQIYELSGLQSSKLYEIKLCAENKIGTSPNTDSIMVSTSNSGSIMASMNDKPFKQTVEITVLMVICTTFSVILIVAILITFLLTRKKYTKKVESQTTKEEHKKKWEKCPRKLTSDRTDLSSQSIDAVSLPYLGKNKVTSAPDPRRSFIPEIFQTDRSKNPIPLKKKKKRNKQGNQTLIDKLYE